MEINDQCRCGARFAVAGSWADCASVHRDWISAHKECRGGAGSQRLRDAIRVLADSFDEHSAAYNAMWRDGYSQYYEGRSDQADEDCSALRTLLREGGE